MSLCGVVLLVTRYDGRGRRLRVCQLRNTTTDAHLKKEERGTAQLLRGEEKASGEVFHEVVKGEAEAIDYLLPTPLSPYEMADGTNAIR